MKLAIVVVLSCLIISMKAQEPSAVLIKLQPYLDKEVLVLNEEYTFKEETISIETLKFYVSNILLLNSGEKIWEEANSFHLIDLSDKNSLDLALNVPASIEFNAIQFNLGIDSLTNVSGAMGGELDPTKGMYWTWQTGYINFKVEGASPVCQTRHNAFQFHLGGYLPPFANIQTVRLTTGRTDTLKISADMGIFFKSIDLATTHKIMSPGKPAQKLSKLAATIFQIDVPE